MSRDEPCPLCRIGCPVDMLVCDVNRRTSSQSFNYHRCLRCGLLFVAPLPENLAQYYPRGYVTPPSTVADLQRIARRIRYQMDLLRPLVRGGRLLEIGPGYGSFLWLAKQAGFTIEAIEPDEAACEYLRGAVGAQVFQTAAPHTVMSKMLEQQYAAVVLWHSIEHLPDPWDMLREAARLLTPDGVMVIATPNPAAWQFGVLGRHWPHVDAPRHLWLIPLDALEAFLGPLGVTRVLATTGDPGGRRWDRFGWSQALMNLQPGILRNTLPAKIATRIAGQVAALAFSPWERAAMKGAAYTAVFQKRSSGAGARQCKTSHAEA